MKTAIKMFLGFRMRLEGQNLCPFLVRKYIKNYSYQNKSIIKVVLLFLYSTMKKNRKDSLDICHRKMTENQNCAIFDLPFQINLNT